MIIINSSYKGSFVDFDKLPKTSGEIAFAGRSNVGKSSLINFICSNRTLAKTSSQPGKTQTFNYYVVNFKNEPDFYFVDLPGYGYAKVSQQLRDEWKQRMMHYFANREQLKAVAVLIDSRIPPQIIDIEFIESLYQMQIPFFVLATKFDIKLKNKNNANLLQLQKLLLERKKITCNIIKTSASDRMGKEEFMLYLKKNRLLEIPVK